MPYEPVIRHDKAMHCDCCNSDVSPIQTVCQKCGYEKFIARPKKGNAYLYCKRCDQILENVWMDANDELQHGYPPSVIGV